MATVALKYLDHGDSCTHFGNPNYSWLIKKNENDYENWSSRFNIKSAAPGSLKSNVGLSKNGGSNQGEAIKALGPLFKQTQVRLRDEINPPLLRKPTGCSGGEKIDNSVGTTNGSGGSSTDISKYWSQRYLLFSRFDEGIKMDTEGWFSVTPEAIAKHHAMRCGGGTIVDCFSGVGGNVIQFAQRSQKVIAIDIDPLKLHYSKHNATIYGVDSGNIHFVLGDSIVLAPKLKGDVVFLSPPWGGPDYIKRKTFDINTMLKPRGGHFLFNMAKRIAPRVVMFLPRNVDVNQLAELALSASSPWSLEVEKNYLNGKLKAITAYFSETKYKIKCNSIER